MPAPNHTPSAIWEWAEKNPDQCVVCDEPPKVGFIICAECELSWKRYIDHGAADMSFRSWFDEVATPDICGNCNKHWNAKQPDYLCPECRHVMAT